MAIENDWRSQNCHFKILQNASKGNYGVIAAIAYNVEQILGLVHAAKQAQSPLILQFFPWAVTFGNGILIKTAADAIRDADVPISIHLDHAQDPEVIKKAVDLPFDSIMVDMSHYEKEENLQLTRELVKLCHDKHKVTEAEPGRIEGGEDGVMSTGDLEGSMTTPDEAEEFVATGVEALAPAFGNVHGEYGPQGPQLDFTRLAQLRAKLQNKVCFALHGTNGFPESVMKECIAAGMCKINVNRLVLDDYYKHLASMAGKIPHTVLIEEGVQKVVDLTVRWMEICGSSGKA